MNLVADYGSSAESDNESETSNDPKNLEPKSKLPRPTFGIDSKQSVFTNKYVAEENEKQAILEQHVKMTDDIQKFTIINGMLRNTLNSLISILNRFIGKKICWEYRKGRCRFGHKCRFIHDSDVIKPDSEDQCLVPKEPTISKNAFIVKNPELKKENSSNKKRRPGLCQTLQPSKKIMTQFKKLNQN